MPTTCVGVPAHCEWTIDILNKSALLLGCILSLAVAGVSAHGFISAPESRAYLCQQGANGNCGAIRYEPQSLEAGSVFLQQGAADGHLASANITQFGDLDEQTAARWTKRSMRPGRREFTWRFTAHHATRAWRYYITRSDWNPERKLTRSSFEATPFCVVDGGMRQPPEEVTHACNVPQRSGYQIILGVWEIGDTANSFYNVVDVMFDGGNAIATAPVRPMPSSVTVPAPVPVEVATPPSVTIPMATVGRPSSSLTRLSKPDFVFPDSLALYRAGTTVLHPPTGQIYQCKPWPNSGYCAQWNAGSNQYEPGVGSAWQSAWTIIR